MLISGILNQVKMHRVHVGAYTHNARSGLLGQVEAGHSGVSQVALDYPPLAGRTRRVPTWSHVSCLKCSKSQSLKSQRRGKTRQDMTMTLQDVANKAGQGKSNRISHQLARVIAFELLSKHNNSPLWRSCFSLLTVAVWYESSSVLYRHSKS